MISGMSIAKTAELSRSSRDPAVNGSLPALRNRSLNDGAEPSDTNQNTARPFNQCDQ